jgi:hypothetical protein
MAMLRFKGFEAGTQVALSDVTVGADSGSLTVSEFRSPQTISDWPRVANASPFIGDTLTLDLGSLSGVTGFSWRTLDNAEVGTGTTIDTTGWSSETVYAGPPPSCCIWVYCRISAGGEVYDTPPVLVYMDHGAMHNMPQHTVDDAAIVALVPHTDVTHWPIADGDWSNPNIWYDGRVPASGARTLIPNGRTVRYDVNAPHTRLDWIRVDGTLNWATDIDTQMLVETIIGTRGSTITVGTGPTDRVQDGVEAIVKWSARDYRSGDFIPYDIALARDPELWGRGIVSQGTFRVWGKEKFHGCLATASVDAGATSLTLEKDPTGWVVGDRIVISGMRLYLGDNPGDRFKHEDEERVISAIDDRTIHWLIPLIYDHDDQSELIASLKDKSIRPIIQLIEGRNVTFQSEYTGLDKPWLRGHAASVHSMCTVDLWGAQFLDMGRSDKTRPVGKKVTGDQFQFHDNTARQEVPFDAQSDIQGRYAFHLHHVGFDHTGARPVVAECYFARTPGWVLVHHACDADIFRNSVREFASGGIVGEQGNELGAWVGNIVSFSTMTNPDGHLTGSAKPNSQEAAGDTFRIGQLYGYRGRAIRSIGNMGFNGTWGHVFQHRTVSAAGQINGLLNPVRSRMDLSEINLFRHPTTIPADEFLTADYPISHFNDNVTIACFGGFFVTKPGPIQNSDYNVKLRNNKFWGCLRFGAEIEYVGTYILDNWHVTVVGEPNLSSLRPLWFGQNGFQFALRNVLTNTDRRLEPVAGVLFTGAATDVAFADGWTSTEPRYFNIGYDGPAPEYDPSGGTQTYFDVIHEDPDWDNTAVDYNADPDLTFPLEVGEWNGTLNSSPYTAAPDNTTGKKIGWFAAGTNIAPKRWGDSPFPDTATLALPWYFCRNEGYYQRSDTGDDVLFQRVFFSNEVTGRPAIKAALWKITPGWTPHSSHTDMGNLEVVTTPIVASDKIAQVNAGGSVVIDITGGATGGNGSYAIDFIDYVGPDRGTFVDNGDGTITYTPDYVWDEAVDEFYLFIRSGDTMWKTIRVNVIIGAGTAPQVPVRETHFDVDTGSSAGEIDFTLNAPPETYGRNIRLCMYSTDNGATWRRLSNLWPRKVHTVTVGSDGNPLTTGNYTVRLRHFHDHEYAYAESVGGTVSVT